MPVDLSLAHRSDTLLFLAVVVYSLAMLGFAAEFSFSRRAGIARALTRADAARASTPATAARIRQPAAVGAGVLRHGPGAHAHGVQLASRLRGETCPGG